MIKSSVFEVDGTQYETSSYPGTLSLTLLARLTKIAGKPLAALLGEDDGKKKGKSILEADAGSTIKAAITALVDNFDAETVAPLVKDLLCTTVMKETGSNTELSKGFDIVFAGRIGHMFKVLTKVLLFQYGDFFGGLAVAGEALNAKVPRVIKAR